MILVIVIVFSEQKSRIRPPFGSAFRLIFLNNQGGRRLTRLQASGPETCRRPNRTFTFHISLGVVNRNTKQHLKKISISFTLLSRCCRPRLPPRPSCRRRRTWWTAELWRHRCWWPPSTSFACLFFFLFGNSCGGKKRNSYSRNFAQNEGEVQTINNK